MMWERFFIGMLLLIYSAIAMGQNVPIDTLKREIKVHLPQRGQVSTEALQPRMSNDKPWMKEDDSMPSIFEKGECAPSKKSDHYTLHPYNTTTPFNWDPVYKRSIAINKDTWRGRFWQAARSTDVANMGVSGYIKFPASNPDKIHFENGALVGDYATLLTQYFTSEFWRFRAKKNRESTLQLLKKYNSIDGVDVPENVVP